MRAAWWWIDRWRKSSAYSGLTLAEQGAYRNLLDELWLRNGILPNDERQLANVCGDAKAWKRVREKVLARFTLTPEGYRNETHDEVSGWTDRQSAKGKARASKGVRDKGGKFQPRHQPKHQPHNQPDIQPPSPSPTDTFLPSVERARVADAPAPDEATLAAPTRPLIDHWRACRKRDGLGPERSQARHAKAFADLWGRCEQITETATAAISAYFANRDPFTVTQGHSIGEFQRTMDRWIREANGTALVIRTESRTARTYREAAEILERSRNVNAADEFLPLEAPK